MNAAEITLRPGRPLDAGRLGAMLSDFVDRAEWMPRLHSRSEDIAHAAMLIDRGWVTVAEAAQGPLGFIARDGGLIHSLYVSGDAQSAGVGRRLLEHAMAQCNDLQLWVFEANRGAQRFYERAGFVLADTGDGAGNDEGLPDRRYVWSRAAAGRRKADNPRQTKGASA